MIRMILIASLSSVCVCVCSRLSLLLPPVGECEAGGGSVVRVGGHQPEDRGSQHAAGCRRETGGC